MVGGTHELTPVFRSGATRVVVGRALLEGVGERSASVLPGVTCGLLVTDANLAAGHAAVVGGACRSSGIEVVEAVVRPGDGSKSLAEAERLYSVLSEHRLGRDSVIVAVGGGMVSDLAGFVAGTWMRGIPTVLCPTTLEADVDAAIGGKTGVNYRGGKNLVGVFHHPRLVVIDTDCLATLPDRDLRAGAVESIKHAVIVGEDVVAWHEANAAGVLGRDAEVLGTMIRRDIGIKADIVARDEREESGERELLNFGHTVGHAVEAVAGYQLRHGECVSLGMVAACRLSSRLGLCSDALPARVEGLLRRYELPTLLPSSLDQEAILGGLGRDKKSRRGSIRFVLPEALGRLVVRPVESVELLREVIESLSESAA